MGADRYHSGDLVVMNTDTGVFPAGVTPGTTKGMVQPRGRGYGAPPEPESFPVIWSNGSWTWETPRTVGPTHLDPTHLDPTHLDPPTTGGTPGGER